MADLFTPDGILLISKSQSGIGNARDEGRIIQRCRRGVVDHVTGGEMDVLELEGLTPGALSGRFKVLCGTKQPEEGDNDEVDGVFVEGAMDWVFCVKDLRQATDDGDVGRVGPARWVIVVLEGLEEIRP